MATGQGIATINADGTGLQQLTTDEGFSPAWSPGGATIAYADSDSILPMQDDILLLNPLTGHKRTFIRNGDEPAWKPR